MKNLFNRPVPRLGFGCMRLPETPEELYIVEECQAMFDYAMANGLNYFDSAWHYIDSQKMIGMCLEKYPRESYILVGKLCFFDGTLTSLEEAEEAFQRELDDARTDYMDLELIHALGNPGSIERVNELDVWRFMRELKARGRVKHIGISYHSTPENLDAILTDHPEIEVVQIQANYYDHHTSEKSRSFGGCYEVYQVCRKHKKPVIIMEPVKGGNLATVDRHPEIGSLFQKADPSQTPTSWALRYAASLDGVLTVLSGMSSLKQMEENYKTLVSDFEPLAQSEKDMLKKAAAIIERKAPVGCTACGYCVEMGCPANINIPKLLNAVNILGQYHEENRATHAYRQAVSKRGAGKPSECQKCGACEKACPQNLNIIKHMEQGAELFEAK